MPAACPGPPSALHEATRGKHVLVQETQLLTHQTPRLPVTCPFAGLVYACGVFLGTERPAKGVAANMGLIAFGVLVCALGELNLVPLGLAQQLTALGFEALRLTLVQILINGRGLAMNPLQSLYYVSPACLLCLTVPFLSLELPRMYGAAAVAWTMRWEVRARQIAD